MELIITKCIELAENGKHLLSNVEKEDWTNISVQQQGYMSIIANILEMSSAYTFTAQQRVEFDYFLTHAIETNYKLLILAQTKLNEITLSLKNEQQNHNILQAYSV